MTDFDDRPHDRDEDPGDAYRRHATERTPRRLDRKVLGMAMQDAASGAGRHWLSSRIRALAFVATAGLSLALLVQLSDTPGVDFPGANDTAGLGSADSVFRDAARETAQQIRRLEAESGASQPSRDEGMPLSDAAESAQRESILPAEDRCQDADRQRSSTWWQCIRELEKRGLSQAAELELQALLRAFPQFSAPRQP